MGMFQKFATEKDGVKQDADRLGGFSLKETGLYDAVVKLIYFGTYDSGAQYANVELDIDGHIHRERINFTNKNGENTYKDRNTGNPKFLPGFEMLNDLALVSTGSELVDLEDDIEERTVKVYDYDARAELPTNVPCLVPAMGQTVTIALVKQIVDKQKKNDSTGEYENTGETREENVIEKFFHTETRMTAFEAKSGMEEGAFIDAWAARNEGKEARNKAKGAAASAGTPDRPQATRPAPAAGGTARKNPFAKA